MPDPANPPAADATSDTATLAAAREHARRQAAEAAQHAPTPAPTPDHVTDDDVRWRDTIEVGNYTSAAFGRGDVLRLVDTDGDACGQLLVFRRDNTAERLNVADTVKVQWQAYLGPEALLLSDMGRVLATIIHDTSARHDCLCGGTTLASATAKWGNGAASGPTPNTRDLLVLGAAKHGLTRRDVHPHINLFKGVTVHDDGSLEFQGGPQPGAVLDLRFEMDVIVVLANTPHPLDPRPDYSGSAISAVSWRDQHPDPDPFSTTSPERERAFCNTATLLGGIGR